MVSPAQSIKYSLPRLKRRKEFLRVARSGRKWAAPGLVLQTGRRPDSAGVEASAVRAGFTVTRKVGNAVVRNRAKRRLRAVATQILPSHGADGMDYVLIGRAGTLKRPFPLLVSDLETALKKLDAYRA